jgi:AcrR family transcriptional regulator
LRGAASLAVTDGLAGVSIGSLAAALGIPKSGLHAHFRSATELQLATVAEAARIFAEEVMQPALEAPPGLSALTAVCEAFFAYLERQTFPGGCFLASAVLEMGVRAGPVRLAFELNGIMLATDTNFVVHDDPAVLDLARQIVRQRLGGSAAQAG